VFFELSPSGLTDDCYGSQQSLLKMRKKAYLFTGKEKNKWRDEPQRTWCNALLFSEQIIDKRGE
jgi:hypothetical protein